MAAVLLTIPWHCACELLVNTDRYATGPGAQVLRMELIPPV